MASSSTTFGSDPTIPPNTTFVQADPSNFRAVVQKLTGASEDPSVHKLPLTLPSRLAAAAAATAQKPTAGDIGPKRPNFKLHERRLASAKKMELSIGPGPSPSPGRNRGGFMGFGMGSPVSPLEIMLARGSPRTPAREEKEEERVILEKGFYFLHPSPLSTTDPPQLLPLFPLHSPTSNNNQQQQQPNSSSS